jgi:signal transduction histidine kinase/CheY-like chemotaxis protein
MNDRNEYEFVVTAQTTTLERYAVEIYRLDRAIVDAQDSGDLEAAAIANECAAQFFTEWGKEKIAAVYLQDAYSYYANTGALSKVADLELRYPQLLPPIRSQHEGTNYFTDEFMATLSHEFRNPLNSILGMSEALLEEVFGVLNERQLNAVTTIDRSGSQLLALINNMTDLSLLQVGKLELDLSPVDANELCQFSTAFVKHHAIQKQIQLDLDICADAGTISIDLRRMQQVLIDLLNHAIDSTPVGGRVKLTVTKAKNDRMLEAASLQFAVSDTSKEIPALKDLKFSQPLLTIESYHVGLGLMLVNPIVELHSGTLDCESIIGQGSCIRMSLPSGVSRSPQLDEDSVDYLGTVSGTIVEEMPEPPLILIVEDNELNINTISSYLSAKGYRPIIANDGHSAIEMTQKHHPDLILMDIQMPGMDGFEAIELIRQDARLAEIPIIALTALAMEGDREKCLKAGANEYLTKPVKLKQLNATIQQFLNANVESTSVSSDLWL